MFEDKHDLYAPVRHAENGFRDYVPPPAHHRHTERLTERRIPMGHEPKEAVSEAEAARRVRQLGLTVHSSAQKAKAPRSGDQYKPNRLAHGLAEVFGDDG